MTRHATLSRAAATGLATAALAVAVATLVLIFVPFRAGVANPYPSPPFVWCIGLFLLITPILGALVAASRPDNPTGWLFLVMSFWFGFGFFSDSVARHLPPSWALGVFATLGSDLGGLWVAAFFLLLVLFPTGRLPGWRWRLIPALVIATTAVQFVASLVAPNGGMDPPVAGLPLPLARPEWRQLSDTLNAVAVAVFVPATAGGTFALLAVRLRRARGVERQQLKWFVWAASVVVAILAAALLASPFGGSVANLAWVAFLASLVLLPIAATVATLRYRLFDVDLLIHRTLVYVAVSTLLGAVYVASVLFFQQGLAPLTRSNSLAVAASTLLVAALFRPVRRWSQDGVDRRFYRARYDAARELESLRVRLRSDLDPQRLTLAVADAAARTMQPDSVSVWLREPERRTVTVPERLARKIEP